MYLFYRFTQIVMKRDSFLQQVLLQKKQIAGFLWPVYSHIRGAGSSILLIYRNVKVRENLYSDILCVVLVTNNYRIFIKNKYVFQKINFKSKNNNELKLNERNWLQVLIDNTLKNEALVLRMLSSFSSIETILILYFLF